MADQALPWQGQRNTDISRSEKASLETHTERFSSGKVDADLNSVKE